MCTSLDKLFFSLLLFSSHFLKNGMMVFSLSMLSGQRIPSRKSLCTPTFTAAWDGQPYSLFDLPAVESWAFQRDLKEHHLKTLYRVLFSSMMNSEGKMKSSLKDRLIKEDFPSKHAESLCSIFSQTCSIKEVNRSDGGYKFLVELPNGKFVETVLIRHERKNGDVRYTICVSSQIGCAKKCSFCATGTMGFQGQLTSAEILEQIFLVQQFLAALNKSSSSTQIRNCVFMGMGEPLDNYDSVHEALRGLTHQCLFGFKAKQITVSTVGASARKIKMLADEAPKVSLALSLHSALQESREKLIPSASSTPITQLGDALDYHAEKSGRGAMLEYLLIDGVNDSDTEAEALASFCLKRSEKGRIFVNLIPYNPTIAGENFGYQTPSDERIYVFQDRLKDLGVNSFIRWSSATGRDANGACGQLALSSLSQTQ